MSTWRDNPDLMVRLAKAQNHPAHADQDITTWAGFCDTREELERHVLHVERRAAEWQAPVRRVRAKRAA